MKQKSLAYSSYADVQFSYPETLPFVGQMGLTFSNYAEVPLMKFRFYILCVSRCSAAYPKSTLGGTGGPDVY